MVWHWRSALCIRRPMGQKCTHNIRKYMRISVAAPMFAQVRLNPTCSSEAGSWECGWTVGGFITSVRWQEYFTWKRWGFIRPARGCDDPKGPFTKMPQQYDLAYCLRSVCISKPLIKNSTLSLVEERVVCLERSQCALNS